MSPILQTRKQRLRVESGTASKTEIQVSNRDMIGSKVHVFAEIPHCTVPSSSYSATCDTKKL